MFFKKQNHRIFKKSVISTIYNSNKLYCESYVTDNLMAKKSKPFTDGDFTKQFTKSVAEIICPDFKKWIFLKSFCPTRL